MGVESGSGREHDGVGEKSESGEAAWRECESGHGK